MARDCGEVVQHPGHFFTLTFSSRRGTGGMSFWGKELGVRKINQTIKQHKEATRKQGVHKISVEERDG